MTLFFEALLMRRYKNILSRKFLEQGCWLIKVRCQNVHWIAGDPRGEINRFVNASIRSAQHTTRPTTDVFNRVTVTWRNITCIAPEQSLSTEAPVCTEHGYTPITFHDG